jgi:hypothetical protein
MLAGTIYQGSDASAKAAYPGPLHWTTGCHCTSVLIQNILRAINIAVFRIDSDNPAWTALQPGGAIGGVHAACFFRDDQRVLAHGDNPYDILNQFVDILPFPGEALLVPAAELLPIALAPSMLFMDIVSRPLVSVAARFLTKSSVIAQYQARVAGAPAGSVIPSFTEGGAAVGVTLENWEAAAFAAGARLDAIVEPYLSGPDMTRLQNDLYAIPSYKSVAPAS